MASKHWQTLGEYLWTLLPNKETEVSSLMVESFIQANEGLNTAAEFVGLMFHSYPVHQDGTKDAYKPGQGTSKRITALAEELEEDLGSTRPIADTLTQFVYGSGERPEHIYVVLDLTLVHMLLANTEVTQVSERKAIATSLADTLVNTTRELRKSNTETIRAMNVEIAKRAAVLATFEGSGIPSLPSFTSLPTSTEEDAFAMADRLHECCL